MTIYFIQQFFHTTLLSPNAWLMESFVLFAILSAKIPSQWSLLIASLSLSFSVLARHRAVYVRKDSSSDDFLVVVQSRKWHGRIKPYHDSWERNQSRTSQIDRQQAYLSSNGKYYHSIRKRVGLMTRKRRRERSWSYDTRLWLKYFVWM